MKRTLVYFILAVFVGLLLTAQTDLSLYRLAGQPPGKFVEPEERRSIFGLLETDIRINYAHNKIGEDSVYLRSYEGALTGPTLRIKPGDTIKLNLFNNLPPEPESGGHNANGPHDLNSTNFHTHGLHISPSGNSDNVLITLHPADHMHYQFDIQRDHPPGTFWYHAHKHGSTAVQLGNGMAGALIIEGGLDDVPEIKAAEDLLMVFQQIPYNEQGRVDWEEVNNTELRRNVTLNGQLKPVIYMRPGEVQRWRLVNAGIVELLTLRLAGHQLNRISVDGLATGKIDKFTELELGPGYRADVLVEASNKEGTYYLTDEPTVASRSLQGVDEPGRVLAEVVVAGPPLPMDMPDPKVLAPLVPFDSLLDEEPSGTQRAVFAQTNGPDGSGAPFNNVNGVPFDANMKPRTLKLDRMEEWTLGIERGNMHPFHIHVNPFQVVSVTDADGKRINPYDEGVWRDTMLIKSGQTVKVRSRYTVYTGMFVLHCHILTHEDGGMMELVEIVP